MSVGFTYHTCLESLKSSVQTDVQDGNEESVDAFVSTFQSLPGPDGDKRTAADQSLRNLISEIVQQILKNTQQDVSVVQRAIRIISVTVNVAKHGMCSPSLPFSLLGDILDCLTLDLCDPVFCFIEERVSTWKSPQFYTAGKNYLLRMCNDLLRRLSQAQNTVFCGRIQLFLARLFPLSEKSALNLFSQFNSDNVTIFNHNPSQSILKHPVGTAKKLDKSSNDLTVPKPQKDELWLDGGINDMEVDQTDLDTTKNEDVKTTEKAPIVDFELYSSIWSLQDIFRSPVQCYTTDAWNKFIKNAELVYRVFGSFKLDKQHFSEEQAHKAYFAKFLTSEKLIDLQLNDAMFRRQLLCQFLILFQYLLGTVKFKSASAILSDKQTEWINESRSKIFTLLEETPPNGEHFAAYVKHLLEREEYWITWKNEGCASFIKTKKPQEPKKDEVKDSESPPAKRRRTAESLKPRQSTIAQDFISGKPLGMGSPELTRLWELCPDNLAACKSEQRSFLPTLKAFFAEGIELMDPKNMVEEEYMSYNDPNFQWRALRLLSQRSPLFFASQPAQMQFKMVSQYLKGIMKKLSEEFPQNVPESTEIVQENGEIDKSLEEEPQEEEKEEGEDLDDGEDDDDDDEVLEDDQFENEDALLNDDSQQEEGDSADEGILEPTTPSDALTSNQVTTVAQKLGKDWEKLAPFLGLEAKDITEIKEDSEDVILQARQTLVTWQDRKRANAKRPALIQALTKAGMEDVAKEIS